MASTGKIAAFLAEPRNAIGAGIGNDGRPHLSPNWFYHDGQRFFVSTTRGPVKHTIFRRDPRAHLVIDDCTGFRAVLARATAEIGEDTAAALPRFRAIRDKHAVAAPGDADHLRARTQEGRVLLAITPGHPTLRLDVLGPALTATGLPRHRAPIESWQPGRERRPGPAIPATVPAPAPQHLPTPAHPPTAHSRPNAGRTGIVHPRLRRHARVRRLGSWPRPALPRSGGAVTRSLGR